jgi:hypothetical protein
MSGPKKPEPPTFSPGDFYLFTGLEVPDPITFILGPQWLGQPAIYPRQATLIKVIFLREDLFTEYDYAVIKEWEDSYRETSYNGITPNIIERMRHLKANGYKWFREVLLVMGRRAGKGHVSALAMGYVLWNYMAKGDPQSYYGIARSKQLECLIYAGKKDQARKNLWQDLVNVIVDSSCFQPYVSRPQGETLTVFAPHDKVKMASRKAKGLNLTADQATFRIEPKEATLMSGRGGASFMQGYDEMAHVVASGANRSAEEVYNAAKPALDQFKKDAFIVEPSSPWQMLGQFYKNYQDSLALDPDTKLPIYPEKMMVQLASWDIYKDWEIAHTLDAFPRDFEGDLKEYLNNPIPKFPRLRSAPQEYDDEMRKEEMSNPDTFKVERLCLDPETRVLTADLEWKSLDNLVVGEEIIGFDEFSSDYPQQRKLRRAVVEAKMDIFDAPYQLTFNDGSRIIASSNHRWFGSTDGKSNSLRWIATKNLRVGSAIRKIVEPWDEIRTYEAGYLAGIYDGEGSLVQRYEITDDKPTGTEFTINFDQNPNAALETTLSYLRILGFDPKQKNNEVRWSKQPAHYKKNERWMITGLDDCLRFLGQIRPPRLIAKAGNLWEGRTPRGKEKLKFIVSIDKLTERRLIDLQTSTKTFIAEGLVSHNSQWATTMDAYLTPEKIQAMWDLGEEMGLQKTVRGRMDRFYKGHADPSSSNANFGLAVAHTEVDQQTGWKICVFDYIHHWSPADFPDHHIDYVQVMDELWGIIKGFPIDEFTVDQFSSGPILSILNEKNRKEKLFKTPQIFEITATAVLNWKMAENFKTALNQGWIAAPFDEQADLELKFLQLIATPTTFRVEKQSTGPVTTKDVADAMFQCVYALLGDQIEAMKNGLSADPISGAFQGGITPFGQLGHDEEKLFEMFGGGAGRYRGANGFGGSVDPSRGIRRPDNGGRSW